MTNPSLAALWFARLQVDSTRWNWPIIYFYALFTACLSLAVAVLVAVWSLWMLWVSLSPVWFRLNTELDGVVISAQDVPPTRGPRYATKYILRGPDGHDHEYCAGATSDALPRSMPVGTYLKKPKWTFYYDRDGRRFDSGWDIPLVACFAIGCLVWSIGVIVHEKMADSALHAGILSSE